MRAQSEPELVCRFYTALDTVPYGVPEVERKRKCGLTTKLHRDTCSKHHTHTHTHTQMKATNQLRLEE